MQGHRQTASSRRSTSTRRLLTPGRTIPALAILAGLALFLFIFRSVGLPTAQLAVDMGSMGQHRLNVWLDPDPPRVPEATIIAQVVDVGGNPKIADSVTFRAGRREGGPVSEKEGALMGSTDRTERGRFRTVLNFPELGDWWVDVEIHMGDEHATVRLPVQVAR